MEEPSAGEQLDTEHQKHCEQLMDKRPWERCFERLLWGTRYMVVFAVIFSIISAMALFFKGSLEIADAIVYLATHLGHGEVVHERLIIQIIGAVDMYLIGVILLIVSFGLYELFISQIDVARLGDSIAILDIHSLDELKSRIIKVVVMVLIVTFFQRALAMRYNSPTDMLYLAISILSISIGTYFMNKNER
ncbi:MAG: YqhA family protein [Synergistales bacterium]|nr:YqhA family protein [Synergistales bacterium]